MSKTLTEAIEELKGTCNNSSLAPFTTDLVDRLAVYQNALSHPFGEPPKEELAICYTVGTLQFTHFNEGEGDVRYGLLDMDLFNVDGLWNGRYMTIWKPELKPGDDPSNVPVPAYTGPFDKVVEKIPPPHVRANSNASFEFRGHGGTGKGTIYATGPINLLITSLKGGDQIFQVSVATYITGGTGDFEGVRGTNTALGSSFIPKGVNINDVPEGVPVPSVQVSTFRFVRKKNQG